MESVLILCDKGPFGNNTTNEAIRIGSGFLALGEDIDCKIVLMGDAVNFLNKNLNPSEIGMDSLDSGIEMADLTDMKLILIAESLHERGITEDDLIDYGELEISSLNALPDMIAEFDTVFKI